MAFAKEIEKMKALSISHLSFAYAEGDPEVLTDLSFDVEEGEYVSLIGHNGSGKSTLAKLVTGLLGFRYQGSVEIFGISLSKATVREARKNIGLVFQNPDKREDGIPSHAFSL